MRKFDLRLHFLGICCIVAVIGVYLFVLKPSAAEPLSHNLTELIGPDGTVTLDSCNLSLTIENAGQVGSPTALSKIVMKADLRNYDFETVHFTPRSNAFGLRIDRGDVSDRMLAQLEDILEAGGEKVVQLLSNTQSAKEILRAEEGDLSFQVMAKVVTKEDGSHDLLPHADAPEFFQFTQAVEELSMPTSYRSTTTFAPGGISAETILTGQVIAIPPLQFYLKSKDDAIELAHAFHDYAQKNECN